MVKAELNGMQRQPRRFTGVGHDFSVRAAIVDRLTTNRVTQFRQMNANSLPVDIFSPLPRDPDIDVTQAPPSPEPVKPSN